MSRGGEGPVLFFDGDCSFCSRWIDFVLRWEKVPRLRFCASQSAPAKSLLSTEELALTPHTILLRQDGKTYLRSDAVLLVLRQLRWLFPMGYLGALVPRVPRDWLYDLVARNRHSLGPAECALSRDPKRFLG